jgi:hypothetical protein
MADSRILTIFPPKLDMGAQSTQDTPRDSGPAFKAVVRICGLVAIGSIFLPFLGGLSILDYFQHISENADGPVQGIQQLLSSTTGMGTLTNALLLASFLFYALLGLSMLLRAKYAGGPLTFLIIFNVAAFFLVQYFGADAGLQGNFFQTMSYGYWIGTGGLFLPFIAMFFLDKSI